MSVKNKSMMNIIGKIEDVDNVVRDLLETKKVTPISAIAEIEKNNFLLDVKDENVDRLVDLNFVHFYKRNKIYEDMLFKSKELQEVLGIDYDIENSSNSLDMGQEEISASLQKIYEEVKTPSTMLDALKKEIAYLENFHTNSFKTLSSLKITIDELRDMEYFSFKLGILTTDDKRRLKDNYESILAVSIHAGSSPEGEVFLVIYPKNQETEITRTMRSLYFKEIVIPKSYKGTTKEILEEIESNQENLIKEIKGQEKVLNEIKLKHEKDIKHLLSQVYLISRVDSAKEEIAISDRYFYFSSWITKSDKGEIQKVLSKYDDIFMIFKEETELNTATNIRSSKSLKRFERSQNLEDASFDTLKTNEGISSIKRFGQMLFKLDNDSIDLRKRHEEKLKSIKKEGQEEIKKYEQGLLERYSNEAEDAYQDALNAIEDFEEVGSKDLSYYDKVISDIEEVYIKAKPELIRSLWNEILIKEE